MLKDVICLSGCFHSAYGKNFFGGGGEKQNIPLFFFGRTLHVIN